MMNLPKRTALKSGNKEKTKPSVAVIGAGPAGLFACDRLVERGIRVDLYDRMNAPLCKFMVAGAHGGLNISNKSMYGIARHTPIESGSVSPVCLLESLSHFSSPAQYGERREEFARFFSAFSPEDFESRLSGLGCALREGSGGKLFPDGMDAPEIARRWRKRLVQSGLCTFYPLHSLVSLSADGSIGFSTGAGGLTICPDAAVFALGGASWPSTGSDGSWIPLFEALGCAVTPLESSNCGFEADWPPFIAGICTGVPVKNATLSVEIAGGCVYKVRGELVLTPYGIEGSIVYALGREIRRGIAEEGRAAVFLDLAPDLTLEAVQTRLGGGPGKTSASTWLKKALRLDRAVLAIIRERLGADAMRNPAAVAPLVKRLPIPLYRARPIAEAISSAGGLSFDELDESLMIRRIPGWFCAGEMLDWDAPTGGFLMQGCFTTGFAAAEGAADWLAPRDSPRS
jgi:hypothetical protein